MAPEQNPPAAEEVIEALRQRDVLRLLKALASQHRAATAAARAEPKRGRATVERPVPPRVRTPGPVPDSIRPMREGLSPGEVPRSGSASWFWIVAVLLAWLGYRYWSG